VTSPIGRKVDSRHRGNDGLFVRHARGLSRASILVLTLLLVSCASVNSTEYMAHVEGNLWRGSRQTDLTKLLKFQKIINLEGENKYVEREAAFAAQHGIVWRHYAMSESPLVRPAINTLMIIEADIEADPYLPTYIHCRRGKDRTGIVVGDYRIIKDGWSATQAYEEMKAYGHASWFYPGWRSVLDEVARRIN
jgi:hypothetical protein